MAWAFGVGPRSELLKAFHESNEDLRPVLRADCSYDHRLDLHVRAPNSIHHPEQVYTTATLPIEFARSCAAGLGIGSVNAAHRTEGGFSRVFFEKSFL